MKILGSDFRKGFCKIKVDNMDDLWVLSQIIEPKDLVKARTLRKIKLGQEGDRKSNVVKKPVTLMIEVEKVEFHKYSNSLRVSGIITEGPDDIPHGSHHTIDVNENTTLTINKEKWLGFQIDKVKDAASDKTSQVLICVMDRDEACFALVKKYGYDYLSELQGDVQKKEMDSKPAKGDFYTQVISVLKEYVERYNIEVIVIASPAFWKEDLMKVMKQKYSDLVPKVIISTCNATGKNGINEVLKRPEISSALKQERVIKETALVEELLVEISKNNLAVYGLEQTKSAAESGAIKNLLITDKLIQELRKKEEYEKLDSIMKLVDQSGGDIVIISEEHDAGKKLQGLGGIGGILRYKINY
ncbi:MAG: mRNA surveillance protein pelota [Nanoarchaeota archaeon]|nr:mRNA surveillance protein pelota [Nanoarchaeota archaeon]MCG2717628.1 mRNA surveillance protein pelota [Nanoarchaeota archaeon]